MLIDFEIDGAQKDIMIEIEMLTEKGIIKKTILSAYGNPRKGGIYAIDVRENDKLIEAKITDGSNDILLGTREGKSIRFREEDVRPSGRKTMGVRGIRLSSVEDKGVGDRGQECRGQECRGQGCALQGCRGQGCRGQGCRGQGCGGQGCIGQWCRGRRV